MHRALRHAVKILLPLALVAIPAGAWFLFKPIRALVPELANVRCYQGGVCVDDPVRLAEAQALRTQASAFVEHAVGSVEHEPKVIFCATATCERWFGFNGNTAYSLGNRAVVVSTHGWQRHFIQHELIHCVQVERIGGLRMWLSTPTWFIEGMAYSMSEDPRRPLMEPWEEYRARYERWAAGASIKELWSLAKHM